MKSKNRGKSKQSNRQIIKQTAANSPTPAGIMPSMFSNAQNTNITGGSFNITTNFNTSNGPSLDVLHKRVAPNSILNAGGRADEVKCHPGTRKEVIDRIEKWGGEQDDRAAPMFWLSGPAGAGKSAIMQTVAERCDQRGVPQANFFFFRADSSRSHVSPLIATLLHQIILLYPSLRDQIATVLFTNPLIFDSVLENQVAQLIVKPLRAIQQASPAYRPLLLLVDGLDECDSETRRSQQRIIHAFDKFLEESPCPFRLLVASRDESQIRAAFNRISSRCLYLYLDDQYSPESDIRVFVEAQFEEIRKTHPLAQTLDATWPLAADIDYIVEKSSGQFIYAATAMRFILDSSASPVLSLERVKGAAQIAATSPFSYLDAIYSYILSHAGDQETLKDILRAQLTKGRTHIKIVELLELYNRKYTRPMVVSCLADLTPIASYNLDRGELLFYHASFSDYLLDKSRSGDYFVDVAAFNYRIMPVVWTAIEREPRFLLFGIYGLQKLQKLPPGFIHMLASASFEDVWSNRIRTAHNSIFVSLYSLCICDDDFIDFRHIFRQWIDSYNLDKLRFNTIKHIPFSERYFTMARIFHHWRIEPSKNGLDTLSRETVFDRQELALWLKKLLHRIHQQVHDNEEVGYYTVVLQDLIEWAVRNDIPCNGLDDLPGALQHIDRCLSQKLAE